MIEKDCSKLPQHKQLVSNNFAFSYAMTDVQTIPVFLFQMYF